MKNQIIRMKEEVSPHFEISSIMKHFDQNGPILFFEKVKGRTNSVVANVCGTRGRLCTALIIEPEHFARARETQRLIHPQIRKQA